MNAFLAQHYKIWLHIARKKLLRSTTSIEAHQALPRLYAKESCKSLHRRVIFIEGLEPREHYADVSQEQSHV